MRKSLFPVLFIAASFLIALPSSATTTCTYVSLGGFNPWWECVNSSPTTQFNFGVYSSPQMCSISGGYYKSTGTYGYGTLEFSLTSQNSTYANSTFDISLVLDVANSHSSNLNRIAVIVYNDTDSTSETIATIDGSGGDICSGSYNWQVTRSGWVDKNLRLSIQTLFWHSDTEFRVSSPSFRQHI